jgi:hypothetical protein
MTILISGGSGLVGSALTRQLLKAGHELRHLSRNAGIGPGGVSVFTWDPERNKLDPKALEGVDYIINLAGAPIASRWTPQYKSEVLRSRVDGTRLLFDTVKDLALPLAGFISASAVGYYPNDFEKCYTEEDPPGSDFLSLVCQKWEQEASNFEALNIKTIRMRIGIVLSAEGGALPKITAPIKMGLGAALGSGKQWMPWIHIDDLIAMFQWAVEEDIAGGVYNAVGLESVTNLELTQMAAQVLKKPLWLPKVPAFALKLMLGEMAETVLASNRVSAEKIVKAGFKHRFTELEAALKDCYKI